MADFATSETQDRMISLWVPTTHETFVNNVPTANYYKGAAGYIELSATNTDGSFVPIQQGSMIITTDSRKGFIYQLTANPGSTTAQTGIWKQ